MNFVLLISTFARWSNCSSLVILLTIYCHLKVVTLFAWIICFSLLFVESFDVLYQVINLFIGLFGKLSSDLAYGSIVVAWMLQVYLSLCCALIASAAGAYFHVLWNIGGLLTTIGCMATMAWLLATPPHEEVSICLAFVFLRFSLTCQLDELLGAWLFGVDDVQQKRVSLLMAAGLLEGASIGPLIELAIDFDPR